MRKASSSGSGEDNTMVQKKNFTIQCMSSNCAWNLWHLVTDLLSCCGGPLGGTVGSGASLSAIRYI